MLVVFFGRLADLNGGRHMDGVPDHFVDGEALRAWLSESAGRCVTAVPVGPYLYKHLDNSNDAWENQGIFVRESRATPTQRSSSPKLLGS